MIITPYSAQDELANTVANFPFLANSYYWDGSVNTGITALTEVTGGSSYDPTGTLATTTNGVNIPNASGASTTLDLSRLANNGNLLLFVAGKPDFLTTNAGVVIGGAIAAASVNLSVAQSDINTLFTVGDGSDGNTATVANEELQDQMCAIMVSNPTGSSISADYYLVAEDGSTVTTAAITQTNPLANLGFTNTAAPVTVSKYTSGSGVLRAFGLISFATAPTATELKGLLSWMHWQIKTNAKRGLYPGFKGKA